MLVMTRFSMRSRTATHSLATLSIIACISSAPASCLLNLIVYANIGLSRAEPVFFPEGIRIRARPRRESVTDSYREPAVQWLSDLPLKLAIGFEPPIMQRRKRLRQLIWNIGP